MLWEGIFSSFILHFAHSILLLCCSVTKLCQTLCDPMDYSTTDSSVFHYLPEFAQIQVQLVSNAIQPTNTIISQILLTSITRVHIVMTIIIYCLNYFSLFNFLRCFFIIWTIFKVFIEFVTILFLFYIFGFVTTKHVKF